MFTQHARNKSRRGKLSRLNRRKFIVEQLEARQLLAADFIVDMPTRNLELQVAADKVQVLDLATDPPTVVREEAADDIDSKLVSITAASLLVDSAVDLEGNSLVVSASRINFSGGSVTTAGRDNVGNPNEDSGDVLFSAQQIIIGAGSVIDTNSASAGFADGTLSLIAADLATDAQVFREQLSPVATTLRSAKIDLSGATLRGRDIMLKADGIAATRWDDIGALKDNIGVELLTQLQQIPQIGISQISPLSGQAKVKLSTSEITVLNSTIDSSTSVTINATADSDASINAVAINGTRDDGSKILVSVAFSTSQATASIDLDGNTEVNATHRVDIGTHATTTANVESRADANSRASSNSVQGALNLSGAYTQETSTINLAEAAKINAGGTVKIEATGKVENTVGAETSVFEDGTAGLAAAVGVDYATITADIRGQITSNATGGGAALTAAAANIDPAGDRITFDSIPAAMPLVAGERIVYEQGSGDLGLDDGREYIIYDASDPVAAAGGKVSQSVRLIAAEAIDIDSRQVPPESVHTLRRISTIRFDAADVSTEAGTGDGVIALAGLPADVSNLVYLGPSFVGNEDAVGIAGLTQNQNYEAVRDGNNVKLRLPGTTAFIDFAAPPAGTHGFSFVESVVSFRPNSSSQASAVDNQRNTIRLPAGHGLQTGDLVFYRTDSTRTLSRDIDDFGPGDTSLETLGTVALPDAPIDGLRDELGYRVVVDPDDPNQIRLTTSIFAVAAASIQDLKADSGSGHRFVRELGRQGIVVNAHLDATNSASTGAKLSDKTQPWAEVAIGAAGGQPDSIAAGAYGLFNGLRDKLETNSVDSAKQTTQVETDSRDSLDLAGALSVAFFDHDVLATIATTAILTSTSDLVVDASISQSASIGAESTATRRGVDDFEAGQDPGGDGEDTEISAAVAIGIYNNDAQAIIDSERGINVNAQTLVSAKVDYPLLADSITAGMNPFLALATGGLDGVEGTLDGTLGLTELFNVQVSTVAGATGDALALAGGIAVTDTTNNVVARIGDSALINQLVDLAQHDPSVSVIADLSGQWIEAGQMASYNLDIKGLIEALQGGSVSDPLGFLGELVNPFGVSGQNAAGGVMLLTLADNQTVAEIGDQAMITADGVIEVSATSNLYNLAVVQTGARSTDFGFSASITAADIDNLTHASISNNAKITAGSLEVAASDTLNRVAIAGAILRGRQTGIGTSVSVNLIDQDVAAFVDRSDNSTGNVAANEDVLAISGPIDVTAITDGDIFALAMAGAAQGFRETSSTGTEGGATANVDAKKIGPIALTIPVAYNELNTDVSAHINNLRARSEDVHINARSQPKIQTVVVGASFAVQAGANAAPGKLNLAGAGAVGLNTIEQNVAAFIKDSDVETAGGRGVIVKATDQSSIESDAGGFGFSLATTPQNRAALSFGVSVAVNDVSGTIQAHVEDSVVTLNAGDIAVEAKSESTAEALAIAGALSARSGSQTGGSFGGAGAAVINEIAKTISAQVTEGSSVTVSDGALTVQATDNSQIVADAGGVGISLNAGSGSSVAGAVGIAVALNEIANNITASIDQSTVDATGHVLVSAALEFVQIDAFALAAAGGVAGGAGLGATLAGAGSGAHNDIGNSITASIIASQVDSSSGPIDVLAADNSTIDSNVIGATISVAAGSQTGFALAVGISIAKNEIGNRTQAFLRNATLDAGGGVVVNADQNSTIKTSSIAASVGVGAGGSTGAGISGAGAGAINEISNQTLAYVDGSTVRSSNGLQVLANDLSAITAEIIAAAAAVGGGGTGLGAAIGVSVAENRIGDASTFAADPTASRSSQASVVQAYVNQSEIDVDGSVDVLATGGGTINATVDAVSMAAAAGGTGGAGAGAGVSATNVIEREIITMVQDSTGAGIDGQSGVFVTASDQVEITTTVLAASLAVAVGNFSAAGLVAVSSTNAKINNKVQAGIRRSTVNSAFGTVTAIASENAVVSATATAAAASASLGVGISASGGGAISHGEITSVTDAHIRESTVNAAGMEISAYDFSIADVQTEAIAISIGLIGLGVSGSSATSIITPRVDAVLIDSDVNVNFLHLYSTSQPVATADAAGLAVSNGLSAGVSTATVELGGRVGATIDSAQHPINAESLYINASAYQFQPSRAFAQGSAGGLLLGADATVTSATNETQVIAAIEDNTILNILSWTHILAYQDAWQEADSSSFAPGLAAAGITKATAQSNTTTIGKIDDGVKLTTGTLNMDVFATDTNIANTTSGAAGGISGAVALPSTVTNSTTETRINDNAEVNVSGAASIFTHHRAFPNTTLTAAAGGLLSGGGGIVDNDVDSTVTTRIGNGVKFNSNSLRAEARNIVEKADLGTNGNVNATAGGIIAGVGVDSDTVLSLRTLVEIGEAAELSIGDSLTDSLDHSLTMLAENTINATDQLTLRSGGIAAGGDNNSSIRTLVNDAQVLISRNAIIDVAGSINASARGHGDVSIQANSETYGAATVGAGLSEIRITPKNVVNVGLGAMITAMGDIDFSSGTDTAGNEDQYDINSRVDTFASSVIPIDIMDATAELLQDNQINIFAGANVKSAGNIRLHAERFGDPQIKAQVKAVNWTTGLTSAIDGLFAEGGTEQFKGTATTDAVGTVLIDGNVETGIRRNQVLEIDRVTRANVPEDTPDSPELFTVVLSARSTDGVSFSKTLTPVTSSLDVALSEAYKNLELYDENPTLSAFYNNEITRIHAKLEAQNLLETLSGEFAGTKVPVQRIP
ncbi:beta strand repeat-containing protein [Planctomycetaceae bacterium SH139]